MSKLMIITGIIILILGGASLYRAIEVSSYGGQIIFNSEQDYAKFKQSLIDTNAKWHSSEMSVLSSSPPIIVTFKGVEVSANTEFPYGNKDIVLHIVLLCFSIFLIAMGLGFILMELFTTARN